MPAPGCLVAAGLGPSSLPASRSPAKGVPRLIHQRQPTHQLAFASRLRARLSELSRVYLPAVTPPQEDTKLWGNAKIVNSFDDVFIAESGRVVKQFLTPKVQLHSHALAGDAIIQGPRRSSDSRWPLPQPSVTTPLPRPLISWFSGRPHPAGQAR